MAERWRRDFPSSLTVVDTLRTHSVQPWEVCVLVSIALVVRLAHVGSATPTYDEFYHLLAARGWLATGSFSIGTGSYERAIPFTRIVAESIRLFGDTIIAGRLPAVIAGALWAVAVFVWTKHVAGALAAWTSSLLFAVDPVAIHLSQWVRFYTLHGLLIWVGAVCVYSLVSEPFRWKRAGILASVGAAAFALATLLMATSLIAIASVAGWAAAILLPRVPILLSRIRPGLRGLVVVASIAVVGAGIWLATSEVVRQHWYAYSRVAPWTEADGSGNRWYVRWLSSQYPLLWVLYPVAAVVAVARAPRPALFALWMFVSAFVVVSLGGSKADRYLYFAMPFFFVLWGMALATFLPAVHRAAERTVAALAGARFGEHSRAWTSRLLTAVVLGFVISQTGAIRTSWRMVFPGNADRPYRMADWPAALRELRPLVDSADIVVSSYVLKPVYYLGRGDVTLSRTEVTELAGDQGKPVEFAIDPSTGRPAISTPESLGRVMSCYETGIVLTEKYHINRAILIPEETTTFLAANTTQIPLPPDSWVLAYRWHHSVPPDQPGCPPWRAAPAPRHASARTETPVR